MTSVMVLNATHEPLHRVSVRHAIRMLIRNVAEVVEQDETVLVGDTPLPVTVRLLEEIKVDWRKNDPKWSKRRLFARDNYKCGYCGQEGTTIDHILPVSRGGLSTWENTIAACFPCNNAKDNMTPEEAGLTLLWEPRVPTWQEISL